MNWFSKDIKAPTPGLKWQKIDVTPEEVARSTGAGYTQTQLTIANKRLDKAVADANPATRARVVADVLLQHVALGANGATPEQLEALSRARTTTSQPPSYFKKQKPPGKSFQGDSFSCPRKAIH